MIDRLRTSWFALLSPLLAAVAAAQASPPAARTGTVHGTVQGVVRGPLGEPMPNVEVRACKGFRGRDVVARTRSDAVGMFVIGRLPATGNYQILAAAEDHTTSSATVKLDEEQLQVAAELRIYEAKIVRGRVIGPDGEPVAGAAVLATKDNAIFVGDVQPCESRTDADGRFELRGVPIGECVVRAWTPGYAVRQFWPQTPGDVDVELQLLRQVGCRLEIVTEGLPAEVSARTDVCIYPAAAMPAAIERPRLGDDGSVALQGLPDLRYYVRLDAPGFTFEPRDARVEPGGTSNVLRFRAVADGSFRLRGRLCTVAGAPLDGERVVFRGHYATRVEGGHPSAAVTGVDGSFEMTAPLIEGERYSLFLADSAWVLKQAKSVGDWGVHDPRFLARWEETAAPDRELELLAVPAATVKVRLVDERGLPQSFVTVCLEVDRGGSPEWFPLAYATSSRDGQVAFGGLPETDGVLRVHAEGDAVAGDSDPFELASGELHQLVVVCRAPGVVTGRVLDAAGKPAIGVRVSLGDFDLATGRQSNGSWPTVPSDRNGLFAFTGVAPGGHRLQVGLRGPGPKGQSKLFAVEPGETVDVELSVVK